MISHRCRRASCVNNYHRHHHHHICVKRVCNTQLDMTERYMFEWWWQPKTWPLSGRCVKQDDFCWRKHVLRSAPTIQCSCSIRTIPTFRLGKSSGTLRNFITGLVKRNNYSAITIVSALPGKHELRKLRLFSHALYRVSKTKWLGEKMIHRT